MGFRNEHYVFVVASFGAAGIGFKSRYRTDTAVGQELEGKEKEAAAPGFVVDHGVDVVGYAGNAGILAGRYFQSTLLDVLYHGPLREDRFPGKPQQEQQ